jgi:hypothetical protein
MTEAVITSDATMLCRPVTPSEIEHYDQHGWAKLPGFITPETVAELIKMAKTRMGDDGQGNSVAPIWQPFFNPEGTDGPESPVLRPLLEGVGHNSRLLMGRHPGVGVRYFGDLFAVKLPVARQTSHPGAGATYCHQDFINWGVDRSGGMTFWIALADLTEELGTMSFYSGSHRQGVLGHYGTYREREGASLLDDYPDLPQRCANSGPMSYRAGDATVHSVMLAHSASENTTDDPRWAWLVMTNPSDVRWTGAPPEAYDTTGMTHLQPLDDEARFPLIG